MIDMSVSVVRARFPLPRESRRARPSVNAPRPACIFSNKTSVVQFMAVATLSPFPTGRGRIVGWHLELPISPPNKLNRESCESIIYRWGLSSSVRRSFFGNP